MPPMGLMSVSPVERTAMAASTLDSAMANTDIQGAIPKTVHAVKMVRPLATIRPPIHHLLGIWSSLVSAASVPSLVLRKVLRMVLYDRASCVSASATMIATPTQRIQPRAPEA